MKIIIEANKITSKIIFEMFRNVTKRTHYLRNISKIFDESVRSLFSVLQ